MLQIKVLRNTLEISFLTQINGIILLKSFFFQEKYINHTFYLLKAEKSQGITYFKQSTQHLNVDYTHIEFQVHIKRSMVKYDDVINDFNNPVSLSIL